MNNGKNLFVIYMGRNLSKAAALSSGNDILIKSCNASDGLDALLDGLENEIGAPVRAATIAGFFGGRESKILESVLEFGRDKKISNLDISGIFPKMPGLQDPSLQAIHLTAAGYDTDKNSNLISPVGMVANKLSAKFFAVLANREHIDNLMTTARGAYVQPVRFVDIMFAMQKITGASLLIHLGSSATRIAVATQNAIVHMADIDSGQNDLTILISKQFGIDIKKAEEIKTKIGDSVATAEDAFEYLDGISVADLKDTIREFETNLAAQVFEIAANGPIEIPDKIVVFGGGANIKGMNRIYSEIFGTDVRIAAADAGLHAVLNMEMNDMKQIKKKSKLRDFMKKIILKITHKKCPVHPSSLAFGNMTAQVLKNFTDAGITDIHYDFMDGEYVNSKAGSPKDAANIQRFDLKFHAHLMATDPGAAIGKFMAAGANSIILSTGSKNLVKNLAFIKQAGIKCGIALNPDDNPEILTPILKHLDKIVVMSVVPGAGGQEFMPDALNKISRLKEMRKKLKFEIIVDGGIKPDNANFCWKAGADAVVSGSYLANAYDLKSAVRQLIPTSH